MLLYLAFKNVISKKSSFVIILFIAFAVMMLVVTNAVFDSTEHGVQETFVSSFTGDIVIRPKYKAPLSLFGDETPVTGTLTELPTLVPYDDIQSYLSKSPLILDFVPQVSGIAGLGVLPDSEAKIYKLENPGITKACEYSTDDGFTWADVTTTGEISGLGAGVVLVRVKATENYAASDSISITLGSPEYTKCCMFGVPVEKYIGIMKSIKILEGSPWAEGEKGIMLSKKYADKIGAKLGDSLNFVIDEGFSSRTRSVVLTAIYEYSVENPTLDKIVLTSPATVRAIMDMSDLASSDSLKFSDDVENMLNASELDDLFSGAEDVDEEVKTEKIEISRSEIDALQNIYSDSTSWNFIICRVKDSKKTKHIIKTLNKTFAKNDWPCEAVNWRSSAGSTAFYLFVLRFIMNIGIIIILGAGFIVVNNTLVINVLDRIREIGTMRAIGANKRYITKECASETMIMAVIAGILGCVLGIIASNMVSAVHITFSNSFLIQLFGGTVLSTSVNALNLLGAFLISIFVGLIAWVYPLINALHINPVEAMQGVK